MSASDAEVVWSPTAAPGAELENFVDRLATGTRPASTAYDDVWRWSIDQPSDFWTAIADDLDVWSIKPSAGLVDASMPGAQWFPGGTLNYAEVALRRRGDAVAVRVLDEAGEAAAVTCDDLYDLVRRAAAGLRRLGLRNGDRVAAYLPNRLETLVAFLATVSIGAVWTATSPDFGEQSALDRFQQVEPTVLLAVGGYRYGGRSHDRRSTVKALIHGLPTLRAVVAVDELDSGDGVVAWAEVVGPTTEDLVIEPVPFDHPLWIVYTSGTTGRPKSIVHGHGGIALEHHKLLRYQLGLGPDDTFFWFSTTGWVMWNILIGGLIVGSQIVLYDGSPTFPDTGRLWDIGASTGATFLGLSAGFVQAAMAENQEPADGRDLSLVRSVGITGSPLPTAGYHWLAEHLRRPFIASISGGTDVATAFVGSTPALPVRAGWIQRPCLGVDAAAFDEGANQVFESPGELVVRQAVPSMPLRFWGDDGTRYRSSYFDRFPGVWCHGDWVEFSIDGGCVVHGRSDATLNRGGVRMGSGDFYSVLDRVDGLEDSLVFDTTSLEQPSGRLVLVLATATPAAGHERLMGAVRDALRSSLSPRHVPDDIVIVERLPRTLNGKRLEVPVKRLFQGASPDQAIDPSAIDDVDAWPALVDAVLAWRARAIT